MISRKTKSVSIKKYKNKREMNLGILLFAIVFIYLVITLIMYFSGDTISIYEVREGSIVKDTSYTGLVIREEHAVNAESDGYVCYYQNENSKVKTGMYVYALSPQKLDMEASDTQEDLSLSLNQEMQSGITYQIQNFNENYSKDKFSAVYALKSEINSSLQNAFSSTRMDQLGAAIAASGLEVSSYAAQKDGIVAFTVDGYESLSKDTFTEENFDRSKYEYTVLSDQMAITSGNPVYRLITSENWSIIVPLEEETAEQLTAEKVTSIKVRIDKDSETLWGDLSVIEKNNKYYGCLDFDNSMIRYAQERYLNVELILEDESGLKIPKSAVVEENFYAIPRDYITEGGNSSLSGVMVSKNSGAAEFKELNIFDASEEEVFVSRDSLKEGTVLIKPESSETYTVGKTKQLQGVYNVNKGYAVFKKVTILCENDEYYIVQEGENYGLSNYDHIVQEGNSVSQDEVVFQ